MDLDFINLMEFPHCPHWKEWCCLTGETDWCFLALIRHQETSLEIFVCFGNYWFCGKKFISDSRFAVIYLQNISILPIMFSVLFCSFCLSEVSSSTKFFGSVICNSHFSMFCNIFFPFNEKIEVLFHVHLWF